MKKSWKKALLAGLSIVMMGSFIAGCGSNNGADNKDVLKVGVTNFASTLEPTENFFAWVVMRYGVGETLAKFDEQMKPQPAMKEPIITTLRPAKRAFFQDFFI